jgi:hypothetical protein
MREKSVAAYGRAVLTHVAMLEYKSLKIESNNAYDPDGSLGQAILTDQDLASRALAECLYEDAERVCRDRGIKTDYELAPPDAVPPGQEG